MSAGGPERQRRDEEFRARWVRSGHWLSAAACLSADPELFFPISDSGKGQEQVAEAKTICAGCRVRRECLAFALRTRQAYGIWGGMTEAERAVSWRRLPGAGRTASARRPA
jgi:WhiB family transcriptional regulator, redox-sensing transcriptional regulator